jgi:putative nucleotidyltransferase with HDIG domain
MRLEYRFLDVVRAWGESIESKDRYTQGHCERVAAYACALASASGMDAEHLRWFRMGALLHDVGKIVVPSSILNKSGRLTAKEWAIMKRHPQAGVHLLGEIEFPWDIRPMVRHHHEHWDGGGYPDGLVGNDIPFSARILCLADVFDALTSNRSYRGGLTPGHALSVMREDCGRIFDPALFEVFEDLHALAPRGMSKRSRVDRRRGTRAGPRIGSQTTAAARLASKPRTALEPASKPPFFERDLAPMP